MATVYHSNTRFAVVNYSCSTHGYLTLVTMVWRGVFVSLLYLFAFAFLWILYKVPRKIINFSEHYYRIPLDYTGCRPTRVRAKTQASRISSIGFEKRKCFFFFFYDKLYVVNTGLTKVFGFFNSLIYLIARGDVCSRCNRAQTGTVQSQCRS